MVRLGGTLVGGRRDVGRGRTWEEVAGEVVGGFAVMIGAVGRGEDGR